MRLFISYAHDDEFLVRQFIVETLRNASHDPWFDHHLVVGRDWKEQLLEAITNCDAFVYAITPESLESEWCQWEFARAIELGKPIIPVLLQRTPLPDALSKIQYVDFSKGPTHEAVGRLMGGLFQIATRIPLEKAPDAPTNPSGIPAQAFDLVATKDAVTGKIPTTLLRKPSAIVIGAAVIAVVIIVLLIVSASAAPTTTSQGTPTQVAALASPTGIPQGTPTQVAALASPTAQEGEIEEKVTEIVSLDATPSPTESAITSTPKPTFTPVNPDELPDIYRATGAVNLRREPNGTAIIGGLTEGTDVEFLDRSPDGSWLKVKLESGVEGWAAASYLRKLTAKDYNERGRTHFAERNYEIAVLDFTRAIRNNRNSAYYYNRAWSYYQLRSYNQALTDASEAIKIDRNYSRAYNLRGDIYTALREYGKAETDYTAAIGFESQNGSYYEDRALFYRNRGRYDEAIGDYTSAISITNETEPSPTLYASRGYTYYLADNYVLAITDFDEAIRLDPEYAYAYRWRGQSHYENEEYQAAVEDYTAALDNNYAAPSYTYYERGRANYELRNYDDAFSDYSTAIAQNYAPLSSAYYELGRTEYMRGNYDQAVAAYDEAIRRTNQPSALYYYERGRANHALGNYDAAIDDQTQAIELGYDPLSWAYVERGRSHSAAGEYDAAINEYTYVIEQIDPDYWVAYNNRCYVLNLMKNYEAAVQDCNKALALNTDYVLGYINLGDSYYGLERYDEALANYQRYLELVGDNPSQYVVTRVPALQTATPTPRPTSTSQG